MKIASIVPMRNVYVFTFDRQFSLFSNAFRSTHTRVKCTHTCYQQAAHTNEITRTKIYDGSKKSMRIWRYHDYFDDQHGCILLGKLQVRPTHKMHWGVEGCEEGSNWAANLHRARLFVAQFIISSLLVCA